MHVSRKEGDRLLCGRTIFSGLQVQSTVDFSRVQACMTCQSVADGLIDGAWASTDTWVDTDVRSRPQLS